MPLWAYRRLPVQALLLARLEARGQAGAGDGAVQDTPLWGWVPDSIYTLIKQCAPCVFFSAQHPRIDHAMGDALMCSGVQKMMVKCVSGGFKVFEFCPENKP